MRLPDCGPPHNEYTFKLDTEAIFSWSFHASTKEAEQQVLLRDQRTTTILSSMILWQKKNILIYISVRNTTSLSVVGSSYLGSRTIKKKI